MAPQPPDVHSRRGRRRARPGGLIAIEAGIGLAYAILGFALFSYFERSARANATLDVR